MEINFDTITKEEAKKHLERLAKDIAKYNYAYHVLDKPLISDAEYDYLFNLNHALETKFPSLIREDSPSKVVGDKPSFSKIAHLKPMFSISNCYNEEEFEDFIEKSKKFLQLKTFPELFCELKIDGLSFTSLYKEGELVYAATRGDGMVGENITENVKMIKNFPLTIQNAPSIMEVRGEIYMSLPEFKRLNENKQAEGEEIFANPRNAAAGSIRQLDPAITKERNLRYFVYGFGEVSKNNVASQEELIIFLRDLGFETNPESNKIASMKEAFAYYEKIKLLRENLDYEIDGVVYKINDFNLQERLGFTARTPRFIVAYKFPAIIAKTRLNSIKVQVGRTGSLTPVAVLDPVEIAGVTVSSATLHNHQEIERKDIRVGDIVFLQRAGDVIPKILAVDMEARTEDLQKFEFPKNCPSCNSLVHFDPEEAIVRCDNILKCPAQIYEHLVHFVSRKAFNIEGLGKQQILFFLNQGLIKSPADIFTLEERNTQALSKIEFMPGFGKKSVENLFSSINQSREIKLERFIYALGIRHIGENNAKLLAHHYKSLENFLNNMKKLADKDEKILLELDSIDGIGEKFINQLIYFFETPENIESVNNLIAVIKVKDYESTLIASNITEKIIVFTGSMEQMSRSEAKALAERLGAKVGSQISKNVDILVAGAKAGSKLKEAQNLGLQIISEEEFLKLIQV